MKVYPFIIQKTVIKEIKVNEQGEVIEQTEKVERETVPAEVDVENAGQSTLVVQEFDAEGFVSRIVDKTVDLQKEDRQKYIVSISQLANQVEMIYDLLRKDQENLKTSMETIKGAILQSSNQQGTNEEIKNIADNAIRQIKEAIEKGGDLTDLTVKIESIITAAVNILKDSYERSNEKLLSLADGLTYSMDKLYKDVSSVLINTNKMVELLSSLPAAIDGMKLSLEGKLDAVSLNIKESSDKNMELDKMITDEIKALREDNKSVVEVMKEISEYMKNSIEMLGTKLEEISAREEELIKREKTQTAKEYNDRGIVLYYRSMYKSAIEEFKKTIELDENLTEVYNNIAMAYMAIGEYENARNYLKIALEKDPDFTEAHLNMAFVYYKEKDFDKALEMYSNIVNAYPSFARAHTQLGSLLFEMKKYEEAEKEWEKALALNPYDEEARKGIKMLAEGEMYG